MTAVPPTSAASTAPAPVTAGVPRLPWETVLLRCWRPAALVGMACVALAFLVWGMINLSLLYDYVLRPESAEVRNAQIAARNQLAIIFWITVVPGAALVALLVRRARLDRSLPWIGWLWPIVGLMGLPFLFLPTFEFEHPYLTGAVVLGMAFAVAVCVRDVVARRSTPLPDLRPRQAWLAVGMCCAVFVGIMGFMAHWRFITFHAEPYDTSWETNAVWGIVHHAIPTISVGADSYYSAKRLPTPYFDLHAPLAYYLYAPFFALWSDPRMLLWLQALWMASGAAGAFLLGQRWLRTRWAGVALAAAYVLNPFIQNFCLHDIHANILAVPTMMLALGFMEIGRVRLAVALAILAALCREETGLYAACLGLFWAFTGDGDRRRVRAGLVTAAASMLIFVLVARVLMPAFGGQPRWSHFGFFFWGAGMVSQIAAFLFNPLGALVVAADSLRAEFFFLAFLPLGFLAVRGWRGAWFLLLVATMMVASSNPSMFSPGVNYSAPMMPAVLVMSFLGMRRWLLARRNPTRVALSANRAAVVAYALVAAVFGNILYGSMLSKSYKLEYGEAPYRRDRQYDYRNHMGYVVRLPAYGNRERGIWEAIDHVPRRVPVATSWALNPQLSAREVSFSLPYLGEGNPPENRPRYVIVDKLPPMVQPAEPQLLRFRNDPGWRVFYENDYAAVFQRK